MNRCYHWKHLAINIIVHVHILENKFLELISEGYQVEVEKTEWYLGTSCIPLNHALSLIKTCSNADFIVWSQNIPRNSHSAHSFERCSIWLQWLTWSPKFNTLNSCMKWCTLVSWRSELCGGAIPVSPPDLTHIQVQTNRARVDFLCQWLWHRYNSSIYHLKNYTCISKMTIREGKTCSYNILTHCRWLPGGGVSGFGMKKNQIFEHRWLWCSPSVMHCRDLHAITSINPQWAA